LTKALEKKLIKFLSKNKFKIENYCKIGPKCAYTIIEKMDEAEDGEILDSLVEFDPISDDEDSFSVQEEIQDNGEFEYERMKQRILELEQRNLELEKIASVQTFGEKLKFDNPNIYDSR
jgi:hypothetical protein